MVCWKFKLTPVVAFTALNAASCSSTTSDTALPVIKAVLANPAAASSDSFNLSWRNATSFLISVVKILAVPPNEAFKVLVALVTLSKLTPKVLASRAVRANS